MEQKKVMMCTCENCGNEAEMIVKCEEVVVEAPAAPAQPAASPKQAKGSFTCTQCGNEADMIIDL
jgi:predicted RNA-binding Zn-ribbon protein involved in translation (DUF1610 family)